MKLFSILLIGILISGCSYLPNEVEKPIGFTLTETSDYILLSPENNEKGTGIMFVPGGLVDPHAYIKTFERFAIDNKFSVLILKVRSNLAIFNTKQAIRVRNEFEGTKWFIGGHSLGGVVAAMAVDKRRELFEGLYLMGSYSINNISEWKQPVFSFLAENDGLTQQSDVEENAKNLPEGITINSPYMLNLGDTHGKTVYYTILGGNHGQFGNYGAQEGDGPAEISAQNQQNEFYNVMVILIRNCGYDI